jgi:hypothetical protein
MGLYIISSMKKLSSLGLSLKDACKNGHVNMDILNLLLADPRVDPSSQDSLALYNAVRLLQDPRVDPTAGNNRAIRLAVRQLDTAIVARLLQDPRVQNI